MWDKGVEVFNHVFKFWKSSGFQFEEILVAFVALAFLGGLSVGFIMVTNKFARISIIIASQVALLSVLLKLVLEANVVSQMDDHFARVTSVVEQGIPFNNFLVHARKEQSETFFEILDKKEGSLYSTRVSNADLNNVKDLKNFQLSKDAKGKHLRLNYQDKYKVDVPVVNQRTSERFLTQKLVGGEPRENLGSGELTAELTTKIEELEKKT
jgi:hypothetical protein